MFDRCWLWRRQLTRRADGELPARQVGALENHLSRCARCQAAAEADHSLRDVLGAHTGLLEPRIARRFDDRVVTQTRVQRRFGVSCEYTAPAHDVTMPLAFLTQIAAGGLAAAAITAICLVPALHPNVSANAARDARQAQAAELGPDGPPVPLESLLQTASPRAALLWTVPRARAMSLRPPPSASTAPSQAPAGNRTSRQRKQPESEPLG